MTLADGLILFLLIVSAGMGLARGFVREITGLVGLLAAIAFGALLGPGLAGSVFGWIPPPFAGIGAFLTVFLAVLFISALVGRLLTAAAHAASLSFPNRVLGGLFGLVRAACFLLALLFALDLVGVDAGPWLKGSRLGEPAWQAVQRLREATGAHPMDAPVKPGPPGSTTI
ncbi:MAG TPA: CvpA family protein [Candidatus Eisenbacteria bacterium]